MQPKQQRALNLLLAGHPTTAVAAEIGVRRETVWRWAQDPAFAAEVPRLQAERSQPIHAELDAGVLPAGQVLRGLVSDPEISARPSANLEALDGLNAASRAPPHRGQQAS